MVFSQGLFQQPVQNNNDGFYFINATIEDQKRQKTYYKDLSKASLAISLANQENLTEGLSHIKTSKRNDYEFIDKGIEFEHRLHYDADYIEDSFDSLADISETESVTYESILVYR